MAGGRRRKTRKKPFTGAGLPLAGTDGQESEAAALGKGAAKDAHDKRRALSME